MFRLNAKWSAIYVIASLLITVIMYRFYAPYNFRGGYHLSCNPNASFDSPGMPACSSINKPALPAAPTPWLIYAGSDPATGARVLHARLQAQSAEAWIELQSTRDGALAWLSLPVNGAQCAAIGSIFLGLDGQHSPTPMRASGQPTDDGCSLQQADGQRFLTAIQGAHAAKITAGPLTLIFTVEGLDWQP